jgi:1,4-dihydroxy-2-naphthoate octaprenyltransferase
MGFPVQMKSAKHWILATRPKTLPAAAIPVFCGGALASAGAVFKPAPWLVCLVFALLIQIGTNFANDYYDFLKGADDERRIGPSRAVASGWISPAGMRTGMILVFSMAFLTGCLLIPFGGWWLVLVGIASIACGVAYTGGPYPLGYNGWGDVFVLLFFGWVATGVTFYVQAGTFAVELPGGSGLMWNLLAGMVPGALATNLLVVNNVRDEPLDREVGKRTLVVRFGRNFGLAEHATLAGLSIAVPLVFAIIGGVTRCYAVLLAVPFAIYSFGKLKAATTREEFGRCLVHASLMLISVGGLFSLGLL